MNCNLQHKLALQSLICLVVSTVLFDCQPAVGRTFLRNICRVKGQEENVLRGLGLVVGLNGTGEANDPATMAGDCSLVGHHG